MPQARQLLEIPTVHAIPIGRRTGKFGSTAIGVSWIGGEGFPSYGIGWQTGQVYVPRPANWHFTILVPHVGQG